MAGGTGGHIFPAFAVGQELLKSDYEVHVFTDKRGESYKWDPEFNIHVISSSQMRDSLLNMLKGITGLLSGFFQARRKLNDLQAAAVVGFGGYATLAPVFAAYSQRIPTIIHQGDALLGRVNRLLAPFVNVIATSFQYTSKITAKQAEKVSPTGLPMRQGIKSQAYKAPKSNLNLLVIGGSQGAKFFGDILPKAVGKLPDNLQSKLHITHQCRPESINDVEKQYKKTKAQVNLSQFFSDMGDLYKQAHLLISRAGASSVMEIATVGRPAIFVPYPFATDDHQTANANAAVRVGGAWCYQQKDLTAEKLADHLKHLLEEPQLLEDAAQKISQIIIPNGEKELVKVIEQLVQHYTERRLAA